MWHWKVLFMKGLMKANMRFWKSAKLSEFLILESNLFYPISVEEKKEFLKYSCLTLKRGTLLLCLVVYACLTVGINSKSYLGEWLFIVLKKRQSFLYHCSCCKDSKLSSWKSFSLEIPFIVPAVASAALYWIDLSLSRKELLNVWSYKIPP